MFIFVGQIKGNRKNMESKSYTVGQEIQVTDLTDLQEKKQWVYVVTPYSKTMMLPYELMSWQLQSLLRVKLHKAIRK